MADMEVREEADTMMPETTMIIGEMRGEGEVGEEETSGTIAGATEVEVEDPSEARIRINSSSSSSKREATKVLIRRRSPLPCLQAVARMIREGANNREGGGRQAEQRSPGESEGPGRSVQGRKDKTREQTNHDLKDFNQKFHLAAEDTLRTSTTPSVSVKATGGGGSQPLPSPSSQQPSSEPPSPAPAPSPQTQPSPQAS